jgi:hypothetical protein
MNVRGAARHQPWLTGSINLNVLLSFIFGVASLIAILVFATRYPNPTVFQVRVFLTTLALSAAGVGAVLPGFIEIKYKLAVRAAGALALFVIVYLFQPKIESGVITFVEPLQSPEPIAAAYLHDVDSADIAGAWRQIDAEARGTVVDNFQTMERIYKSYRSPLGEVVSRRLSGMNSMQSPQGYPAGLYRGLSFITKFNAGCRGEAVTLRATQDLQWRVFSHLISPNAVEC